MNLNQQSNQSIGRLNNLRLKMIKSYNQTKCPKLLQQIEKIEITIHKIRMGIK